jgi:hypothetical protein
MAQAFYAGSPMFEETFVGAGAGVIRPMKQR